MSTVDLPLLPLGPGTDRSSERGVECPGNLPAASDPDLVARARAAKDALGERVFVLGHHYQRDEVIAFADVTGDSFKLARDAAARPEAEYIVFCGVHFMAESADILTGPGQAVVLPDLAAGCSMADMARLRQVEDAWDALTDAGIADSVVPVTYMNSSADIKAFCGRHGGAVCTSSNAEVALEWAFAQKDGVDGGAKVLFLPDQHLGRNTAVLDLGLDLDDCVVWDPRQPGGGVTPEELAAARASGVTPPSAWWGSQTTQSSSVIPSFSTAVLRPRCWSGRNSTWVSGPFCSKAHSSAARALEEVHTAPPCLPQKALMSAEEFM